MLKVWVDDGGTRDGSVFLLGALVAPITNWITFAEAWNAELDLSPQPHPSYFKLQDVVRRKSHPELVNAQVRSLNAITQKYVTTAYRGVLFLQDFNELVKPEFKQMAESSKANPEATAEEIIPDGISSPYFLMVWGLLRAIDHDIDFGTATMDVVFDEQAADQMLIEQWWSGMAKNFNASKVRHRLPNRPVYQTDQEFAPLQASNSYAWLANREYAREPLTTIGPGIHTPTLAEFLGDIPEKIIKFDRKRLRQMHESIQGWRSL
jgi:hypothetical protein